MNPLRTFYMTIDPDAYFAANPVDEEERRGVFDSDQPGVNMGVVNKFVRKDANIPGDIGYLKNIHLSKNNTFDERKKGMFEIIAQESKKRFIKSSEEVRQSLLEDVDISMTGLPGKRDMGINYRTERIKYFTDFTQPPGFLRGSNLSTDNMSKSLSTVQPNELGSTIDSEINTREDEFHNQHNLNGIFKVPFELPPLDLSRSQIIVRPRIAAPTVFVDSHDATKNVLNRRNLF